MLNKKFAFSEVLFVAVFVASLGANFILWQEVRAENYTKYLTGKSQCENMEETLRLLGVRCREVSRQIEE